MMSKILLSGLVAIFTMAALPQPSDDPGVEFFREFRRSEGVMKFNAPGWLLWLGSSIAYQVSSDEESRALFQLTRQVRRIRILHSEERVEMDAAQLADFQQRLLRAGYEPLVSVREGDHWVTVSGKIKADTIRRLVILVKNDDEFVFLQARARLEASQIGQVLQELRQ